MPSLYTPEWYAAHQARFGRGGERVDTNAAPGSCGHGRPMAGRTDSSPPREAGAASNITPPRTAGQALAEAQHENWKRGEAARSAVVAERDVQAAILALLRAHPRVAWAHRFNTGGVERENADGSSRYVRFAFPGCADILGMLKGGRFLAIECKSSTGRVTEEQVAFLGLVARHGGIGIVARGVDDVLAVLDERPEAA